MLYQAELAPRNLDRYSKRSLNASQSPEWSITLMLTPLLAVIAGLPLLIWSANQFIDGAIEAARRLNLSPMLIGLTLVAFGTSAPEVVVSVAAAMTSASDIAVGNALGSNIANLGLVLGMTALITPIAIRRTNRTLELPVLTVITLAAWPLLLDGRLGLLDGIALLTGLLVAMTVLIRFGETARSMTANVPERISTSPWRTWTKTVLGLALLIASSRLLVWGAAELAAALGVGELIIGLTVVAIGTSLPELAASVASALKGRHGMALGNIVGSNLFNLSLVLAIPALIGGASIGTDAMLRDYGTMVVMTLMVFALILVSGTHAQLSRAGGGILLALYLGYTVILGAGETGLLPAF